MITGHIKQSSIESRFWNVLAGTKSIEKLILSIFDKKEGFRKEQFNPSDSTMQQDSDQKDTLRFDALFDSATIGIIVVDAMGQITLTNRFAEQQFGYDRSDLLGKKIETLIPSRFATKHTKLREGFTSQPENRPMGIGLDLFGMRKDGSEFPVEISLSHYTSAESTFVIAFITDISIRKQNENSILKQQEILKKYAEDLNTLNQELEQRVEERTFALRETLQQLERSKDDLEKALSKEKELSDLKSRFVSMASHEFRTPLSTILTSANLIEKYPKGEEQDKRQRNLNRIKDNVKNLTDILDDFLSLGKLEEGLIKAKFVEVELQEFINEILHDLNELKKPAQKISYVHSGSNKFVGDKVLLKNILINLTSNAIKFSKDDGLITVETLCDESQLVIHVRDSGIGISKEDQQHLFDRFFRGKNALNIKGTGLGLHIVSKYVELLQGTIRYKTKLNTGTEFIITIPQQR